MHTGVFSVLVFHRITPKNPAIKTGGGRVGLPRVFTVAASDARIGYVTCFVLSSCLLLAVCTASFEKASDSDHGTHKHVHAS